MIPNRTPRLKQVGFSEFRRLTKTFRRCVISALVAGFPLAGTACQSDATTIANVSFSRDVQPILNTNCFRCHRVGGQADLAGIDLLLAAEVSYDQLVNQPSQLDANLIHVVPGDSTISLLFLIVNSDTPPVGSRMPQGTAPLSQREIEVIATWIDEGALNN